MQKPLLREVKVIWRSEKVKRTGDIAAAMSPVLFSEGGNKKEPGLRRMLIRKFCQK